MEMLTFVETKLFTSLVGGYLSDDEYAALQLSIAANPEAGEIVARIRASGSCAGADRAVENAEESVSFITSGRPRRDLDADGVRQERG